MLVFMPVPCRFGGKFDVREQNSSSFVVLSQDGGGYSGPFVAPYKFLPYSPGSVKYANGILLGNALDQEIALGRMTI